MPDLKISEMTLAASLDGTEEVPFAKGGANGKTNVRTIRTLPKCIAYQAAAQSTTSAGWQKLLLDVAPIDDLSMFNAATGRFTPPREGFYLVSMRCQYASSTTSGAGVWKNGAAELYLGPDGTLISQGGSGLVYCNGTTDYLEFYVYATAVRSILAGNPSVRTYAHIVGPM